MNPYTKRIGDWAVHPIGPIRQYCLAFVGAVQREVALRGDTESPPAQNGMRAARPPSASEEARRPLPLRAPELPRPADPRQVRV